MFSVMSDSKLFLKGMISLTFRCCLIELTVLAGNSLLVRDLRRGIFNVSLFVGGVISSSALSERRTELMSDLLSVRTFWVYCM